MLRDRSGERTVRLRGDDGLGVLAVQDWTNRAGRHLRRGDGLRLAERRLRAIDVESLEGRWYARNPASDGPPYHFRPTGAPTVHDGWVYVTTDRGQVRQYDATTGRERWRFDISDQPGITDEMLYDDVHDYPDPNTMPARAVAVVGDLVVAAFAVGELFGLDRETGDVHWRTDVGEGMISVGGLAVIEDACLVTTGSDLYRIAPSDGSVEWRLTERWPREEAAGDDAAEDDDWGLYVGASPAVTPPDAGDSYSSPTAFVDVGTSWPAAQLHAIDVETGAIRWNAPVSPSLSTDPCVGGDVVFVSNGSFLVALDRDGGSVLYGVEQYPSNDTVALVDDVVIAADSYGHVYAIA